MNMNVIFTMEGEWRAGQLQKSIKIYMAMKRLYTHNEQKVKQIIFLFDL